MSKNSNPARPHTQCGICSQLGEYESAEQKYGWSDRCTYLPAATQRLLSVRDFTPYGSRKLELWQCPECKTYYRYKTDYEFCVNGSEDEETLTRLTDEEAAEYLARPPVE